MEREEETYAMVTDAFELVAGFLVTDIFCNSGQQTPASHWPSLLETKYKRLLLLVSHVNPPMKPILTGG